MTIEQPSTKIPILIDYDAPNYIAPHKSIAHKRSNPSRRLVANSRHDILPVKPGRVIADHSVKLDSSSPWDKKFPMAAAPAPVSKNARYDPKLINSAKFRRIIDRPAPMLMDFEDPRDISYSPFDELFPNPSQEKRKSRNRSSRRRRHLQAAMQQYKSEHGPMNKRPVDPEQLGLKSFKSYSPWQEELFANTCNIPLSKFMKAKNIRPMRPFSFSPWSEKFPVFKETVPQKVSLPIPKTNMPAPPTATPFPAFSPLHKRAKAVHRNSVTPSTSAMDMVEAYEMMAGMI